MNILKDIFPIFNFVENIPYNPDIIFTWKLVFSKTNYDIKVFWMGKKIARIRIELNRHIKKDRYYKAEECYVVGRREIVNYLNKKDALIVHDLIDEKDETKKILMSRAKDIIEHGIVKEDRFHNIQYFIPKEVRKVIIVSSKKKMMRLLTTDVFYRIYDEIKIL